VSSSNRYHHCGEHDFSVFRAFSSATRTTLEQESWICYQHSTIHGHNCIAQYRGTCINCWLAMLAEWLNQSGRQHYHVVWGEELGIKVGPQWRLMWHSCCCVLVFSRSKSWSVSSYSAKLISPSMKTVWWYVPESLLLNSLMWSQCRRMIWIYWQPSAAHRQLLRPLYYDEHRVLLSLLQRRTTLSWSVIT